jgi:hypothetical protein
MVTTPLYVTYLNWFDNASPGMVADNIHIVNPGTTTSAGCVIVASGSGTAYRVTFRSVAWSVAPGQETWVTFTGPYTTMEIGPLTVEVFSGPAVLAAQRVQRSQSFNELWAAPASLGATTSYFNWYDNASPGMASDNIHLTNVGPAQASVTVSLPGTSPQTITIDSGTEQWVTFPQGTIGGPVTVSSNQPLLASQRVERYQSFNEIWAQSGSQASTRSYFNWFDNISPGMSSDNIHVLNPGSLSATVSISRPGSQAQAATIPAGGEIYFVQPTGPYGGPVTITSDQPVLASQRVHFYGSFSEVWSSAATQATTTGYFNWYDRASPGMYNDNIHVLNPGTTIASVTVSLPGYPSQMVTVAAGGEQYVNFGSAIGGPITLTSTSPVLASQRVQYYSSFNEIWAD